MICRACNWLVYYYLIPHCYTIEYILTIYLHNIGFFKRHIKLRVRPGANAAKIIKCQLIMRNFERVYKSDDPIGELPSNQYLIPDEDEEHDEMILWNHHAANVTDYNEKYHLIEYLTNYWNFQFRDNRVLDSILDNNIRVEKQFIKGDMIFRCQEYPSTAKKLDTLVKLILPTTSGSGMFFGDILLFFTHAYEGTIS